MGYYVTFTDYVSISGDADGLSTPPLVATLSLFLSSLALGPRISFPSISLLERVPVASGYGGSSEEILIAIHPKLIFDLNLMLI